jgi:hypothetical protein
LASAHELALPSIRDLCESLVKGVKDQLPGTEVNAAKTWCSIGKPNFAFIRHTREGITVYPLCRETDGGTLSSLIATPATLALSKRTALDSPWAKQTPYFFTVNTTGDAAEAVPLLLFAERSARLRRLSHAVFVLPSENDVAESLEGERATIYVNRYERDPRKRAACIRMFGTACAVCGFDFGTRYGDIGVGFIHVHNLNPLGIISKAHKVNTRKDLRPVCPNCHEMLHRRSPPFSIEELKEKMVLFK